MGKILFEDGGMHRILLLRIASVSGTVVSEAPND
jgi:hypothetical protein